MLTRLYMLLALLLSLLFTPLVALVAAYRPATANPAPVTIYHSPYPVITPANIDSLIPVVTLSQGGSRYDKALKRPIWSPASEILAMIGGGSQEDPSHIGVWMYALATPDNPMRLLEHATAYDMTFSRDGRWLASIGNGDTRDSGSRVVVWDLESDNQYLTLENIPIITAYFTQDSTKLITTDWNNLRVWEIETQQEIYYLNDVCNPVLSPDVTMTATTDCDWSGIISLHDRVLRRQFFLRQQNSLILEMTFSPDGNLLAAWDTDENIGLWGLTGNTPDSILRSGEYDIAYPTDARFSPDGTILASWNERGDTVHLWSIGTSEHIASLGGHRVIGSASPGGSSLDVVFSPAVALLASFWGDGDDTEDRNTRLWDTTGTLLRTLPDEFSATFSPDGTMLATDSGDGTVKIWAVR